MIYIFDVLIIFFLFFGLFGFLHTFLASNKIKHLIIKNVGEKIAFYRLFFNGISILTFLAFYFVAPKPDLIIYDLSAPWDYIVLSIQILSLIMIFWAGTYVDMKEFIGIAQLVRFIKGNYNLETMDEICEFRTDGPYKYSRHPIYFLSIVFLMFRSTMDLFYLSFVAALTLYFFVGSFYEEKKLKEKFGNDYAEYLTRVPRIIPIKLKIFSK